MNQNEIVSKVQTPKKLNKLLIEPSFKQGEFDSHLVDCATVFSHDDNFYMIYLGYDGVGYQTGLAVSNDLYNWNKQGVVLGRGKKESFTEYNAAMNCVFRDSELFGKGQALKINGRFVGTYHAYSNPGYELGPAVIGLCFSDDLKTWEAGDPILWTEEGELWEQGTLYASWLVERDGKYYLFYNAKNKADVWQEQIGVATSTDLVNWQRHSGNPIVKLGPKGRFDDQFTADPCVFKHDNWWIMFYYGYCRQDGHARDGMAISRDLLNWQRCDDVLVDIGPAGSIDSMHAHKPSMIFHEGRLYHFYTAVSPSLAERIGDVPCRELKGITFATSNKEIQ